jgi:PAS domain S-box-containing protein
MLMSKNRAPTRMPASRTGPPSTAAAVQSILHKLADASADGIALTDGAGTLLLASPRLGEMFGYDPAELVGSPVERLIPSGLRVAHRGHLAGYARHPVPRPMGKGLRLVGLRKDQTTFPAQISLSPAPAEVGQFVVAVIRDVTQLVLLEDRAPAAVPETFRIQADYQLHDIVVSRLFAAGLLLQAAADQPAPTARQAILEAAGQLDDTISDIRDAAFRMSIARCPQ